MPCYDPAGCGQCGLGLAPRLILKTQSVGLMVVVSNLLGHSLAKLTCLEFQAGNLGGS